jgi:N4-gp56 family major capsid protein
MAIDSILRSNQSAPGGADLFANIVQEAIFTAQERSIMLPLVSLYDISATAGKTIQVPVYPTVSAASLTEGTDITDDANVNPTAKTITASEFGVLAVVTDLMKESAGRNVAADIGRMLGEAIAKKQDESIMALFSGFSTQGATAGVNSELTAEIVFKAASLLRTANAPGPYYLVAHPKAVFNLKKTLAQAGYNTSANAISDIGNEALRTGLIGTLAGITIFENAAMDIDVANGCIAAAFSPQAIGVAVKKGLTIEVQRDASLRADEIVATSTWGVGELVDAYGVRLDLDSAL